MSPFSLTLWEHPVQTLTHLLCSDIIPKASEEEHEFFFSRSLCLYLDQLVFFTLGRKFTFTRVRVCQQANYSNGSLNPSSQSWNAAGKNGKEGTHLSHPQSKLFNWFQLVKLLKTNPVKQCNNVGKRHALMLDRFLAPTNHRAQGLLGYRKANHQRWGWQML